MLPRVPNPCSSLPPSTSCRTPCGRTSSPTRHSASTTSTSGRAPPRHRGPRSGRVSAPRSHSLPSPPSQISAAAASLRICAPRPPPPGRPARCGMRPPSQSTTITCAASSTSGERMTTMRGSRSWASHCCPSLRCHHSCLLPVRPLPLSML